MTILMAYVLVADTWGICIIETARVVMLAELILSQRLSQTCPSIGRTAYFWGDKGVLKDHLIISLISYLTFPMDYRARKSISHTRLACLNQCQWRWYVYPALLIAVLIVCSTKGFLELF